MLTQIANIVWKDVRQSRLVVAVFLVLSATLTTLASIKGPQQEMGIVLEFLVFFATLLLAGSFTQTDSPTRDDAFWKTTPVGGGQLLVAKYAGIALVVLPVFIGCQMVALLSNEVALPAALRYATVTSLPYLLSLVSVLLTAAVTPDLKAFLIALILQIALRSLLTASDAVKMMLVYAQEITWLNWCGYSVSLILLFVMYSVYTRRWSADQSRVAAVAAILVVPLAFVVFQAGVVVVVKRYRNHDQPLPASNYLARLDSNSVLLRLSIKRPPAGETIRLMNPVARIKTPDGRWYRLGVQMYSPLYEDEMKRGVHYVSSIDIVPDAVENRWGEAIAKSDGDSLRILFKLNASPSVLQFIRKRTAPIEFESALVMLRQEISFNIPADSQYGSPHSAGVDVFAATGPDSAWLLQIKTRALGPQENKVREILSDDDQTYQGRLQKKLGIMHSFYGDTALLVSSSRGDTVRLTRAGCGGGSSRTIFLPIPFSVISDATTAFCLDSTSAHANLGEFVKHSQFEYHTWAYSNHIPLRAKLRVQQQ